MADSVSEELQRQAAAQIWDKCSDWVNGVILQPAPHDDPEDGEVAHGTALRPFVSVSEFLPEQYSEGQGWNDRDLVTHTVTVVLFASKSTVEKNPFLWRKVRERAIRSIHKYRFTLTQTGSCVWYANARPQSFLSATAWLQSARFVSAFDLLFRTEEPRLHD